MKIRNKITTYYTILFVISIGLIGVLITNELYKYTQTLTIQRLAEHVISNQELAIASDSFSSGDELLNTYGERIVRELSNNNFNIRLYSTEKQLAAASSGISLKYLHDEHKWNDTVRSAINGKSAYNIDNDLLYLSVPIDYQGQIIGAIEYIYPYTAELNSIRFFQKTFIYIGGICLVLIIISSILISYHITNPIHKLNQSARLFSQGNFKKITDVSSDEIGALAKTFNVMGEAIEQHLDAITNEKDKLNNLLSNLHEGIIAFDDNNEVLFKNSNAITYLGEIGEIGEIDEQLLNNFKLQLKNSNHIAKDWKIADRVFYLDISKWNNMYIAVMRDITLERQWIQNQKQFVANVSHELKTPITAINGYIQIMQQDKLYDDEIITYIEKEGLRLKNLILNLLDLSKLESQYLDIDRRTFSLAELLQSIIVNMQSKSAKFGISITYELDDVWVLGNENMLAQVFINLLDNAIKYSKPNNNIVINLTHLDSKAIIVIQDEGIGINKESLKHVFDRFYRSPNAKNIGGNGLGLSIVKEIVDMHDGTITIVSSLNQGTQVTVKLPSITMGVSL